MGLAHPYEPRESTDKMANLIDQTLGKHYWLNGQERLLKFCLVTVGTGGGKTFMSIHAAGRVIPNAHLMIFTTKKQLDANHWQDSVDSYNEVSGTKLTYTVANYEKLVHPGTLKPLTDKILACDKKQQPVVMILDEAHKVKNSVAQSSKALRNLKDHPCVMGLIALSATPIGNSLIDAIHYLILAGYYNYRQNFYDDQVRMFDEHFQPIVKDFDGTIRMEYFKKPQQLLDQLNSFTIAIDTKNLLPPVNHLDVEFTYDKETQKDYRQINKDYHNGVYDSIQQAIKAQREFIADHAAGRNLYLSGILNNSSRPNDPVLIFYKYVVEFNSLMEHLETNHPDWDIVRIDGRTKKKDKIKIAKPDNPKTVFLIQYKAGAEALNAEWSHTSVFYAPTDSSSEYEQAKGRNVRAFQKGTVYHFRFIVNKTLNEHLWREVVDQKTKFTKKMQQEFIDHTG